MSADRPWQLWDTAGLQRRHLTEPDVRVLVRINEDPAVYGRHETNDTEIRWEDVQHDPLPPGYGDQGRTRHAPQTPSRNRR